MSAGTAPALERARGADGRPLMTAREDPEPDQARRPRYSPPRILRMETPMNRRTLTRSLAVAVALVALSSLVFAAEPSCGNPVTDLQGPSQIQGQALLSHR